MTMMNSYLEALQFYIFSVIKRSHFQQTHNNSEICPLFLGREQSFILKKKKKTEMLLVKFPTFGKLPCNAIFVGKQTNKP